MKYIFPVILIMLLANSQAQAQYRIRSFQRGKDLYLYIEDVAGYYGLRLNTLERQRRLNSRTVDLKLSVERREAVLNGVKINLCMAPFTNTESTAGFISHLDFQVILEPLLRRNSIAPRRIDRIMLDPGHGGKDPGAKGARLLEKNFNLELSRLLAQQLRVHGYTVALTRERDVFISLSKRAEIARNWRADLFISIHANAAGNANVNGLETFFLTPNGSAPFHSNKRVAKTLPGNKTDLENVRLAYSVQRRLLSSARANDRGIKAANFTVLQQVNCPAILVETGFLTHSDEELRLSRASYQQLLVRGIVLGVREFQASLEQVD